MTTPNQTTVTGDAPLSQGLEDLISATSRLATQLREAADGVARLGERELEMIIATSEGVRDRIISPEQLAQARKSPVIAGFRKSGHRALDLGFDVAAVGARVASDLLDTLLRNRADDRKHLISV